MKTLDTRPCLRCGAVTGDIQSRTRKVHVNINPRFISPNEHGEAVGYTLDGRLIRGDLVTDIPQCGAFEVYEEHMCGALKHLA